MDWCDFEDAWSDEEDGEWSGREGVGARRGRAERSTKKGWGGGGGIGGSRQVRGGEGEGGDAGKIAAHWEESSREYEESLALDQAKEESARLGFSCGFSCGFRQGFS